MGSIVYRCPDCKSTEVYYCYGLKTTICRKCGRPLKDFERDATTYVFQRIAGTHKEEAKISHSTKKTNAEDLLEIPTAVFREDAFASSETFDFLKEMKKRIDPCPYSWKQTDIWMTTYPSLDPYLETDRTTMPETRPCMGSVTVHSQRPDGKQAHFGIADFWDIKEAHHNPELWWTDYEGKTDCDKNVKGHRKFDIKENIAIESKFNDETLKIRFRGKRPSEKGKT